MQRPRGLSRRFLTLEEVAKIERSKGKGKGGKDLDAMLAKMMSKASASSGTQQKAEFS